MASTRTALATIIANLITATNSLFTTNGAKDITGALVRAWWLNSVTPLLTAFNDSENNVAEIYTKANLETKRAASGLTVNQIYFVSDATASNNKVIALFASAANALRTIALNLTDSTFGTLSGDVFTAQGGAAANYETVSNAGTDWSDLIVGNDLVPGNLYLVTDAFTSGLYATTWDVLVVADSPNTIGQAWVNIDPYFIGCTTDEIFGSLLFTEPNGALALSSAQILAYVQAFVGGLDVFFYSGADTFVTKASADGASIVLQNVKAISTAAWPQGALGTFDPNTDTFTPNGAEYTATPGNTGDVTPTLRGSRYTYVDGVVTVYARYALTFAFATGAATISIPLPITPVTATDANNCFGHVTFQSLSATMLTADVAGNGSSAAVVSLTFDALVPGNQMDVSFSYNAII